MFPTAAIFEMRPSETTANTQPISENDLAGKMCREKCSLSLSIYAVELRAGPRFALFRVKNWSKFFFLFLKISFSLQIEEVFQRKSKQTNMTQKLC